MKKSGFWFKLTACLILQIFLFFTVSPIPASALPTPTQSHLRSISTRSSDGGVRLLQQELLRPAGVPAPDALQPIDVYIAATFDHATGPTSFEGRVRRLVSAVAQGEYEGVDPQTLVPLFLKELTPDQADLHESIGGEWERLNGTCQTCGVNSFYELPSTGRVSSQDLRRVPREVLGSLVAAVHIAQSGRLSFHPRTNEILYSAFDLGLVYGMSVHQLPKAEKALRSLVPNAERGLIVHLAALDPEGRGGHFAAVKTIGENEVIVLDKGREITLPLPEFLRQWSGYFLTYSQTSSAKVVPQEEAKEVMGCCGTYGEIISKGAYHQQPDVDIAQLSSIAALIEQHGLQALVKNNQERLFFAGEEDVQIDAVGRSGSISFIEYTGRDEEPVQRHPHTLNADEIKKVKGYVHLREKAAAQLEEVHRLNEQVEKAKSKYGKGKDSNQSWEEWRKNRHHGWKEWQRGAGEAKEAKKKYQQYRNDYLEEREKVLGQFIANIYPGQRTRFQNYLLESYLGGREQIQKFFSQFYHLKRIVNLEFIFNNPSVRAEIRSLADRLRVLIAEEERLYKKFVEDGLLHQQDLEAYKGRMALLKDMEWFLTEDVLRHIDEIMSLGGIEERDLPVSSHAFQALRAVNTALVAIDKRLETRGRDSLGVAISLSVPDVKTYHRLRDALHNNGFRSEYERRRERGTMNLDNLAIRMQHSHKPNGDIDADRPVTITFVYKVAEAVGKLGDNARAIRKSITEDEVFKRVIRADLENIVVTAQSRWASAGGINIPNAHPVDNRGIYLIDGRQREQIWELSADQIPKYGRNGTLFVVLNGDIDNYNSEREGKPNLTKVYEEDQLNTVPRHIHPEASSDTKRIPLRIEHYLARGHDLKEAFRLAVNDFGGSFAIQMQSDLEPGKIFLAQHGEGQALYVGISEDGFHSSSEQYGFVESTQRYVEMQAGQIIILDQARKPGVEQIEAYDFDGTPIKFTDANLQTTSVTSRDINIRGYNHFLEKEIHEAPQMWEDTISGKTGIDVDQSGVKTPWVSLSPFDELPVRILQRLADQENPTRKIYVTGMGTADAAGSVVAGQIRDYLRLVGHDEIEVEDIIATELSGFKLRENMSDVLIVAVSQSGKTTDTNTAISHAKKRGAGVLAIVNTRDSKLTTFADGVLYTGTGRDIEIAVASTKAYYAQVGAGALYAMALAEGLLQMDRERIREMPGSRERTAQWNELAKREKELQRVMLEDIKEMHLMPAKITTFLNAVQTLEEAYQKAKRKGATGVRRHPLVAAAHNWPLRKLEWKVLGSGPNYHSAKEGRIKLSELTYSSLPFDHVENYKHIDFSAEPWVIANIANVSGWENTFHSDIESEVTKMLSHNAALTLIVAEDDARFNSLEQEFLTVEGKREKGPIDIIRIPKTSERFAPVLSTLAMHLLAYHVALALNERANAVMKVHDEILYQTARLRNHYGKKQASSDNISGLILKNKTFRKVARERIGELFPQFREGIFNKGFGSDRTFSTMILLMAAAGHISLEQTNQFLGKDYTPDTFLEALPDFLMHQRMRLTRTVDSVLHQAKFVTVGTKRQTGSESAAAGRDGGVRQTAAVLESAIQGLSPEVSLSQSVLQSTVQGTVIVYDDALDNLSIAKKVEQLASQLRNAGSSIGFSLISRSGKGAAGIAEEVYRHSNGLVDLWGLFQTSLAEGEVNVLDPRAVDTALRQRGLVPLELVAPREIVDLYKENKIQLYAWLVSGNPKEGEPGVVYGAEALHQMVEIFGWNPADTEILLVEGGLEFTATLERFEGDIEALDRSYRENRGL